MPAYTAEERPFDLIPEGTILAARVTAIILKSFPDYNRLNWTVEITEGEHKGMSIYGSTSEKFSADPPSYFYKWACELLERTIAVGEQINTDDLIGLPCRIEIGHQADRDDPQRTWLRIADLVRPRGATVGADSVFG